MLLLGTTIKLLLQSDDIKALTSSLINYIREMAKSTYIVNFPGDDTDEFIEYVKEEIKITGVCWNSFLAQLARAGI
jgi:hypothetical protein